MLHLLEGLGFGSHTGHQVKNIAKDARVNIELITANSKLLLKSLCSIGIVPCDIVSVANVSGPKNRTYHRQLHHAAKY